MGNPKGVGRAPRDRTNERYGRLVARKQVGVNAHHQALWECVCDCGAVVTKSVVALNNNARQCARNCPLGVHVNHGHSTGRKRSKEYCAWSDMKRRCLNPNSPNYKNYGGRGITICEEWANDFAAFLAHIGPAPEGYRWSVDRIDNDGNYEAGNVRWATPKQQANNTRKTSKETRKC